MGVEGREGERESGGREGGEEKEGGREVREREREREGGGGGERESTRPLLLY